MSGHRQIKLAIFSSFFLDPSIILAYFLTDAIPLPLQIVSQWHTTVLGTRPTIVLKTAAYCTTRTVEEEVNNTRITPVPFTDENEPEDSR